MTDDPDITINPIALAIMKALAQYRYLTTKQMLAMGLAKDKGHLGKVLASLLSRKRRQGVDERLPDKIGEMSFGVLPGRGRLHRVYYLAKKGAELIEDFDSELAPITYPTRIIKFRPDYDHRIACVDFHVALTNWAETDEQTIVEYKRYYDWSSGSAKARPQPATRLALTSRNIDADAVFLLRDPAGVERLFLFELANDRPTTRILAKMQSIAEGLADRSLNQAMGFPADKAVRVLFVCEHERTIDLVRQRAATLTPLRNYLRHFFLKAIDDISADTLRHGWLPLDPQGEPGPLF